MAEWKVWELPPGHLALLLCSVGAPHPWLVQRHLP